MKRVSFVIPCYNSSDSIEGVVESILKYTDGLYEPEVILSNDGSHDDTWEVIIRLCKRDSRIIGINLSKNFGQQSARMAAVNHVTGDYTIFMDDDGQHDPRFIQRFIEELENGKDIVYADFINVKQSWWRKAGSSFRAFSARFFEGIPSWLHPTAYFAVRRFLIEGLKKYPSPTPSVFGYLLKSSQNIGTVSLEQRPRKIGKSGYSFGKLVGTWLNEMIGFSIIPLRVSSILGMISSALGMVALFFIVIRKVIDPTIAAGYTSIMAVILIFSGIILVVMGILGEYIGRMFMTINMTPQYMIREIINSPSGYKEELINVRESK